jgi:hypothetical protein
MSQLLVVRLVAKIATAIYKDGALYHKIELPQNIEGLHLFLENWQEPMYQREMFCKIWEIWISMDA